MDLFVKRSGVDMDELWHRHDGVANAGTQSLWGPSFGDVLGLPDGHLLVHNKEFESYVNYCPVCGEEARVKVDQ